MAGRKSAYDTIIKPRLEEIKAWCRDGYTDKVMCEALGIGVSTFCKYKAEKPELVEALKVNKQIADQNVVNSLYMRAMGYEFEEITEEATMDKDGKSKKTTKVKTVKKQLAPDVTAQIFWLKNRTKEWTDRRTDKGPDKTPTPVKVVIVAENGRITNKEDNS